MDQEDAVFLVHNVSQILFKKAKVTENAIVGGLMLLNEFSKENLFTKEMIEFFMS